MHQSNVRDSRHHRKDCAVTTNTQSDHVGGSFCSTEGDEGWAGDMGAVQECRVRSRPDFIVGHDGRARIAHQSAGRTVQHGKRSFERFLVEG